MDSNGKLSLRVTIQISVKSFDPGWVLWSALCMTISVVNLRFEAFTQKIQDPPLSYSAFQNSSVALFISRSCPELCCLACQPENHRLFFFISFCSSSLAAAFPGAKNCPNRKFTYDAFFFLSHLQSKICLPLLMLQRLQVVVFAFVLSLQL